MKHTGGSTTYSNVLAAKVKLEAVETTTAEGGRRVKCEGPSVGIYRLSV
jgi:hypothetical protein